MNPYIALTIGDSFSLNVAWLNEWFWHSMHMATILVKWLINIILANAYLYLTGHDNLLCKISASNSESPHACSKPSVCWTLEIWWWKRNCHSIVEAAAVRGCIEMCMLIYRLLSLICLSLYLFLRKWPSVISPFPSVYWVYKLQLV